MTATTDYPPVFSYVSAPAENQATNESVGGIVGVHHVGLPVHQQQHSVARVSQQQQHVLSGHAVGLSGPITGAQQVLSRPSEWLALICTHMHKSIEALATMVLLMIKCLALLWKRSLRQWNTLLSKCCGFHSLFGSSVLLTYCQCTGVCYS